jgi:predicted MFS family arabinose efflux permease
MSRSIAFYLQASIIVFFLAASSAPTPLYALYQSQWGFSAIVVTAVFGIYAIAVLSSLLVFGSLSDYIGRRPVLLAAIAVQAAAMVLFATATGVGMLVLARVIQGISTGAAAGAVGAGMLDIDRGKGTFANSVAPPVGTGLGALMSGAMVQLLPAPTHLIYVVLLAIFVVQALGVLAMPETATPKSGALASMHPHFKLPVAVRRPLLVALPALVAVWALVGFYGSLAPALLRQLVDSHAPLLGGVPLFVFAVAAVVATVALSSRDRQAQLALGTGGLVVGVTIIIASIATASPLGLFAGTLVAGGAFGAAFQGALGSVMAHAAADERAGVLSIIYVICYLAFGVPAVIAGAVVVATHDVVATAQGYGFVVMALAAAAFVAMRARRRVPVTAF